MNPDEAKLAMWLEDELHGEEQAAVEAWAGKQAEHVAAREEVRRWRKLVQATVPASEEPPYGEFFNARIARSIRQVAEERPEIQEGRFKWQSLVMPLAACAGMVFAFLLGTRSGPVPTEIRVVEVQGETHPLTYTPGRGVTAERFASSAAAATVIVLDGVEAIPDATDFLSETAMLPREPKVKAIMDIRSTMTENAAL